MSYRECSKAFTPLSALTDLFFPQHASISKEHAVIEFDDKGNAYFKDLNSLNQNVVNDKKIGNGAQTLLKHGDVVLFGKGFL